MTYFYIAIFVLYLAWFVFALYKTKTAGLLLPLFFPLYLIRFNLGSVPIYFIEGLIILTAIPVFYKVFTGDYYKSVFGKLAHYIKGAFHSTIKSVKRYFKSIFFPISLFMIACLISLVQVPDVSMIHALGIIKSWVILPIVFFFILYYSISKRDDLSVAMYSYIISAMVIGLIGLYQAVSGHYITIDARISGPFESANYLALYISPALIFSIVRLIQTFVHTRFESGYIKWHKLERRIYLLFFIAVLFPVLILSQSYGAIIGTFVAILFYLFYERKQLKTGEGRTFLNKLITFLLIFFVLAGGISALLNVEKFQNLTKVGEHTSIGTRLEIWTVGGTLLKENPIFGIGPGEYEAKYLIRSKEILGHTPLEEKRLHSHNLYMETWLNSGLLGLVSLVWILYLTFTRVKKHDQKENKDLTIALMAMLIYILVHGLIDVPFWKNDLALLFWLIIGGIVSLNKSCQ